MRDAAVTSQSASTGLLASLVELLLPRSCLGCGADGTSWCPGCLAVEFEPVLHRPEPCPPGLPELAAAAPYSGSTRGAILAAKEHGRSELDPVLGSMLAASMGVVLSSQSRSGDVVAAVWLIPVPTSSAAFVKRGRDHVSDWCRHAVGALRAVGLAADLVPALRRRSGGVDSVGLDAAQRAANLSGAFLARRVRPPPSGTTVIVVDDIVTTGATLVSACEILAAEWRFAEVPIRAAVVAATQRNDPDNGG